MAYLDGILGFLICALGVYFFHKKVFEETKSVLWPILFIILGIVFISTFFYKIVFHA